MTDTRDHIAIIRAAIHHYGKDDWFQGCLHGGGIYMRDLWPVLDAASHHAELVEALERIKDEANTVCGDWRETASMIDSICIAAFANARGEQTHSDPLLKRGVA